jgi:2-polyprenyl-3-methyl-5-hydroxy-6-metoxy-1,4-benzoquinol methylase
MGARPLEITDLLWQVDGGGARTPVVKAEALAQLAERGQRRAMRIVARMPATDGVVDPSYADALGVRVHCELQRLSEELQFGHRVAALLLPLVSGLRAAGPVCVLDVGCGLGYVVRWLAATSALGPGVSLVGVDLNPALVAEAGWLAQLEGLCAQSRRP